MLDPTAWYLHRIKRKATVLALVGVSVGFVIGVLFVGVFQ